MTNLVSKYPASAAEFSSMIETGHSDSVQLEIKRCGTRADFDCSTELKEALVFILGRFATLYSCELRHKEEGMISCTQCKMKGTACRRVGDSLRVVQCKACRRKGRCSRVNKYRMWLLRKTMGLVVKQAEHFILWHNCYPGRKPHGKTMQTEHALTDATSEDVGVDLEEQEKSKPMLSSEEDTSLVLNSPNILPGSNDLEQEDITRSEEIIYLKSSRDMYRKQVDDLQEQIKKSEDEFRIQIAQKEQVETRRMEAEKGRRAAEEALLVLRAAFEKEKTLKDEYMALLDSVEDLYAELA